MLSQYYQQLEHIRLYGPSMPTHNLKAFLKKHSKLNRFSKWWNCQLLQHCTWPWFLQTIVCVDFWCVDTNIVDALYELPGLEKLCIEGGSNIDFSRFTHLNELVCGYSRIDWERMARHLVHLERLYIHGATAHQLLPFACHSKKLKELLLLGGYGRCNYTVVDLSTFNEERNQLADARPISIGLQQPTYIATKWSTTNSNLNLIKVNVRWEALMFEFQVDFR